MSVIPTALADPATAVADGAVLCTPAVPTRTGSCAGLPGRRGRGRRRATAPLGALRCTRRPLPLAVPA